MADIIIILVLAIVVVLIVRGQLHKIRNGQCTGGCSGCSGCSGSCSSCIPKEKKQPNVKTPKGHILDRK